MLVSVILPVYNNEGTVLQTVDSVLNQSHEGLQLIIVNDGSTDRSVDLIKSIQDERVIVINQGNKGVSAARNLGFQQATGEYIAFIDADDVWLKTKLEEELEVVFRQSEPVALVYSGYYCVDDKFRVIKRSPDYSGSGRIADDMLFKEGVLLPSSILLHRRIMEELGGFPENLRYHEDRTFFLLATQRFNAYPSGRRLVVYRHSMAGKSRGVLANYDIALESRNQLSGSLEDHFDDALVNRFRTEQINQLFCRFLMYGFSKSARRLLPLVDKTILLKSFRGMLAILSCIVRINFLWLARMSYQRLVFLVYRRTFLSCIRTQCVELFNDPS